MIELKSNKNIDFILFTTTNEEEELVHWAARFQAGIIDDRGSKINIINTVKNGSVEQPDN